MATKDGGPAFPQERGRSVLEKESEGVPMNYDRELDHLTAVLRRKFPDRTFDWCVRTARRLLGKLKRDETVRVFETKEF